MNKTFYYLRETNGFFLDYEGGFTRFLPEARWFYSAREAYMWLNYKRISYVSIAELILTPTEQESMGIETIIPR